MDSFLIRCSECDAVNKVLKEKINNNPKCGSCHKGLVIPKGVADVGASNFDKEVLKWPGVVLVDFWAQYCGHCIRLKPTLHQIAEERKGEIKIVSVNVQQDKLLASQYKILSIPALILFKNGKQINSMVGALPKNQLEAWINGSLSG